MQVLEPKLKEPCLDPVLKETLITGLLIGTRISQFKELESGAETLK